MPLRVGHGDLRDERPLRLVTQCEARPDRKCLLVTVRDRRQVVKRRTGARKIKGQLGQRDRVHDMGLLGRWSTLNNRIRCVASSRRRTNLCFRLHLRLSGGLTTSRRLGGSSGAQRRCAGRGIRRRRASLGRINEGNRTIRAKRMGQHSHTQLDVDMGRGAYQINEGSARALHWSRRHSSPRHEEHELGCSSGRTQMMNAEDSSSKETDVTDAGMRLEKGPDIPASSPERMQHH
jgi:hypothetical protein